MTVTSLLVHPLFEHTDPMHTHMCWGTWLREGSESGGGSRWQFRVQEVEKEKGGLA